MYIIRPHSCLLVGHGELEENVLAGELLVHVRESVELVLNALLVLAVEEAVYSVSSV